MLAATAPPLLSRVAGRSLRNSSKIWARIKLRTSSSGNSAALDDDEEEDEDATGTDAFELETDSWRMTS
jgi:hypothetical protein